MDYTMININKIKRCFERINTNEVHIKKFNFMYQKLNLYLIGSAIVIAFVVLNFFDEGYIKERGDAFNYQERIKEQYEENKERRKRLGGNLRSYEQFYEDIIPRYTSTFVLVGGMTGLTLIPFIIFFLWRQPAPVCVDRKRQLIYTWHRGKLLAARLNQLQTELRAKSNLALEYSGGWGPMVISLYPAGKVYGKNGELKKGKRIPIGTFVPQYDYQNHALKPFIEDYMQGFVTVPDHFETSRSWLEPSPRKPKSLPDQEVLNKAIDEWLKQERS